MKLKSEPVTIESLHEDCVALEERLYRAKAQRDALLAAAQAAIADIDFAGNLFSLSSKSNTMLRQAVRLAESE